MADLSLNNTLRFSIDGQEVEGFLNLHELEMDVRFPNDSIQPLLTISDATLVNEAAQMVKDWFNDVGPFDMIPIQITSFNKNRQLVVFDGCISFDNVEFNEEQVKVKLIQNDALNSLNNKLEAITFFSLWRDGLIRNSDFTDIQYVKVKDQNLVELLIANIILFLMIRELADSIRRLTGTTGLVAGIAAAGISGSVGSFIAAVAAALVELIFIATMIIVIVDLGKSLINTLVPIVKSRKGSKTKMLLEKACNKLGYGFITNIAELENDVLKPSHSNLDENLNIGTPNEGDTGFNALELFEATKNRYTAKYAIIGNNIHLRWINDPFWDKQATFTIPSTDNFRYKINKSEFKSSILTTFQQDISDDWTTDNADGRVFQTITDIASFVDLKKKDVTGLFEVNNPYSLGSRKDELTDIEKGLVPVASAIDTITRAFGRGTNFKNQILGKVGMLKISGDNHSVAKLLYLVNGKLPVNHRTLYSAKSLGLKYQKAKRFDVDNFRNQYKIFNDIRIPFGLESFVLLLNNSYLVDEFGGAGKMEGFKWKMSEDEAIADFRQQYTYYKDFITVEDEPK